ncbi:MAG TPA: hypothetical protein VLJ42_13300 [Solirubrobacteraceae bacterium]|nr:hypothetical protein [Solirubrobacteraceae bacterium]
MRVDSTPIPKFKLVAAAALALLGAGSALAAPGWATPIPATPHYSLAIVEGESTMPENSITRTSVSVQPSAQISVSIVRGGIVIARDTHQQYAGLSQVPQVGDVVNVESPLGTIVRSVVYDGLPAIDATVCAGSANFSGQRSAGQAVSGGYYSFRSVTDPYGHVSVSQTAFGDAQVTLLSGSTYAGNFLTPLTLGQTVYAVESLDTPLAGGAVFSYSSENDRPVAACPLPPVPIAAPAPPALQGSIARLARITIHQLLKSGWLTHVTINQPGRITQGLYLKGGRLPAFASSSSKTKKHPRKPAALLLARGSVTAASAGKVTVVVHATTKGRRRLKHAHSVKAVLITTLHSRSGAKLNLARRTVTLQS